MRIVSVWNRSATLAVALLVRGELRTRKLIASGN